MTMLSLLRVLSCVTLVAVVCGAASPQPASLAVINEGWPLPAGLTITATDTLNVGGEYGHSDATTTLFHGLAPGASSTTAKLPSLAPFTLNLVNTSTSTTVGRVEVTEALAPGAEYVLFVSPDPAHVAGTTLSGLLLPTTPPAEAWPVERTDVAVFRVLSADLDHPVTAINTTSSNCWECLAVFRATAQAAPSLQPPFMSASVPHDYVVSVSAWSGMEQVGTELHRETYPWREAGVYSFVLPSAARGGARQPYVVTHNEGNNVAIPLLVWAGTLLGLVVIYNVIRVSMACAKPKQQAQTSIPTTTRDPMAADDGVAAFSDGQHAPLAQPPAATSAATSASIKPGKRGRVVAIDTFRGMSLSIMIFVNYGGGGYWFLNHSWWNGLTVADLVFPWFVWIMGTSMAISHASAARKGASTGTVLRKMLIRSMKLFSIGLFLNNGYVLSNWRVLGVLQYFAVSGFVVALIAHLVPKIRVNQHSGDSLASAGYGAVLGTSSNVSQTAGEGTSGHFADIIPYCFQYICAALILTTYLCIQFLLEVPGCGRGYIGPGGNGNHGLHRGCTGGAHGYIDHLIFGDHHMYHSLAADGAVISAATCAGITRYDCNVYDPEGTLGYLTCTVMCFLGLQAGRILVTYKGHRDRIIRWVCWGLVECAIGTALCGASQNNGIIPLAKNLWSPSFILVMAGTGNLMLAFMYIIIDVMHWWGGAPLKFLGMNSIVVYAGSEILQMYFPFTIMVDTPVPGELGFRSHSAALVGNTIGVATWLLIAWGLAVNKIFINV